MEPTELQIKDLILLSQEGCQSGQGRRVCEDCMWYSTECEILMGKKTRNVREESKLILKTFLFGEKIEYTRKT